MIVQGVDKIMGASAYVGIDVGEIFHRFVYRFKISICYISVMHHLSAESENSIFFYIYTVKANLHGHPQERAGIALLTALKKSERLSHYSQGAVVSI